MPLTFAAGKNIDLGYNTAHDVSVFTLAAWLQTTDASNAYRTVISKGLSSTNRNFWLNMWNPSDGVNPANSMVLRYADAVTGDRTANAGLPAQNDGIWHHVACSRDSSSNVRMYVDGVLITTTSVGGGVPLTQVVSTFISRESFGGREFIGNLDDVRIYNRVLANNEITTLNGCRGHDGIVDGLVGRWTMAENVGTASGAGVIKGIDPLKINGTPTGSPAYTGSYLSKRKRAL